MQKKKTEEKKQTKNIQSMINSSKHHTDYDKMKINKGKPTMASGEYL